MPEAAMHKNDLAMAGKDNVRAARQLAVVQPEPIAHSMNHAANQQFRFGIARADTGHQLASLALGKLVHAARLTRCNAAGCRRRSRGIFRGP